MPAKKLINTRPVARDELDFEKANEMLEFLTLHNILYLPMTMPAFKAAVRVAQANDPNFVKFSERFKLRDIDAKYIRDNYVWHDAARTRAQFLAYVAAKNINVNQSKADFDTAVNDAIRADQIAANGARGRGQLYPDLLTMANNAADLKKSIAAVKRAVKAAAVAPAANKPAKYRPRRIFVLKTGNSIFKRDMDLGAEGSDIMNRIIDDLTNNGLMESGVLRNARQEEDWMLALENMLEEHGIDIDDVTLTQLFIDLNQEGLFYAVNGKLIYLSPTDGTFEPARLFDDLGRPLLCALNCIIHQIPDHMKGFSTTLTAIDDRGREKQKSRMQILYGYNGEEGSFQIQHLADIAKDLEINITAYDSECKIWYMRHSYAGKSAANHHAVQVNLFIAGNHAMCIKREHIENKAQKLSETIEPKKIYPAYEVEANKARFAQGRAEMIKREHPGYADDATPEDKIAIDAAFALASPYRLIIGGKEEAPVDHVSTKSEEVPGGIYLCEKDMLPHILLMFTSIGEFPVVKANGNKITDIIFEKTREEKVYDINRLPVFDTTGANVMKTVRDDVFIREPIVTQLSKIKKADLTDNDKEQIILWKAFQNRFHPQNRGSISAMAFALFRDFLPMQLSKITEPVAANVFKDMCKPVNRVKACNKFNTNIYVIDINKAYASLSQDISLFHGNPKVEPFEGAINKDLVAGVYHIRKDEQAGLNMWLLSDEIKYILEKEPATKLSCDFYIKFGVTSSILSEFVDRVYKDDSIPTFCKKSIINLLIGKFNPASESVTHTKIIPFADIARFMIDDDKIFRKAKPQLLPCGNLFATYEYSAVKVRGCNMAHISAQIIKRCILKVQRVQDKLESMGCTIIGQMTDSLIFHSRQPIDFDGIIKVSSEIGDWSVNKYTGIVAYGVGDYHLYEGRKVMKNVGGRDPEDDNKTIMSERDIFVPMNELEMLAKESIEINNDMQIKTIETYRQKLVEERLLQLFQHKPVENELYNAEAGVGKSYYIKKHYKNIGKTLFGSPTGIAAYAIACTTLSSLFGLGHNAKLQSVAGALRKMGPKKIAMVAEVLYLVIDEIYTASLDLMEKIDEILRYINNSLVPFGGVKLLMFGDDKQLSAVGATFIGSDLYNSLLVTKKDVIHYDPATSRCIPEYRAYCNQFREPVPNLRNVLEELAIKACNPIPDAKHVYHTNAEVDQHNNLALSAFEGTMKYYTRPDRKDPTKNVVRQYKDGMPIILERNRLSMGLYNGKICKLVSYSESRGIPCTCVNRCGLKLETHPNANQKPAEGRYEQDGNNTTWHIIDCKCKASLKFNVRRHEVDGDTEIPANYTGDAKWTYKHTDGIMNTYPQKIENVLRITWDGHDRTIKNYSEFKPAFALTIHKVQGLTLEEGINVHLKRTSINFNEIQRLLYVAFTRCRSVDKLYFELITYAKEPEIDEEEQEIEDDEVTGYDDAYASDEEDEAVFADTE